MDSFSFHNVLIVIQRSISFFGVLIIFTGVLLAIFMYVKNFLVHPHPSERHATEINKIRMTLARRIILGLEFIVAADLISTTSAPDYYTVGILGIIVLIRTLLSWSLNRELNNLSKGS